MIACVACGVSNEDDARFCRECGNALIRPILGSEDPRIEPRWEPGYEHEFTHGVMRYVPDSRKETGEVPVYLTRQAADTMNAIAGMPDGQTSAAVPVPEKAEIPSVVPSSVPASQGKRKTRSRSSVKRTEKKDSRLAAIIVMSAIGILIILIIVGIAVLLGG